MFTGQTSTSFLASSRSAAAVGSTSTRMNMDIVGFPSVQVAGLKPYSYMDISLHLPFAPSPGNPVGTELQLCPGPARARPLRAHSKPLLDQTRYLRNLLRYGDASLLETADLLGRRVRFALDDRPGVPEAHPRHLVHEAPGHEGHDGQTGAAGLYVLGELGLHGAARLRVDDDRLGLRVRLEQGHQR